jgi:glycine dehydrogenase subunit 1
MKQLTQAGGKVKFPGKVFGEFTLELPKNAKTVADSLLKHKIVAGLPLGPYFEDMENCLLVAVTEIRTRSQIDAFATALQEVIA